MEEVEAAAGQAVRRSANEQPPNPQQQALTLRTIYPMLCRREVT
jgi:hypothetical protein